MPNIEAAAVVLRPEEITDAPGIRLVNRMAFHRDHEAQLVDALRDSGAVIASIVAVAGQEIVGHALFSTVRIDSDAGSAVVASLAPLAVVPRRQNQEIGSALVRAGIAACTLAGHPAVIVVGHPAYYPRFGFSAAAVAHLLSPYAGSGFMGLDLRPGFLAGTAGSVRYPAAFADL